MKGDVITMKRVLAKAREYSESIAQSLITDAKHYVFAADLVKFNSRYEATEAFSLLGMSTDRPILPIDMRHFVRCKDVTNDLKSSKELLGSIVAHLKMEAVNEKTKKIDNDLRDVTGGKIIRITGDEFCTDKEGKPIVREGYFVGTRNLLLIEWNHDPKYLLSVCPNIMFMLWSGTLIQFQEFIDPTRDRTKSYNKDHPHPFSEFLWSFPVLRIADIST